MIGGMLGRINTAERMTVEQLQAAMEQGSLPAYIGVPILQEKVQMRDRALSIPMGQELAQQPPIMEEILQSARSTPGAAPMVEGIDQLPTQLNPAAGMAGGGIVAFDEGGDVSKARKRFLDQKWLSDVQDTDGGYAIAKSPRRPNRTEEELNEGVYGLLRTSPGTGLSEAEMDLLLKKGDLGDRVIQQIPTGSVVDTLGGFFPSDKSMYTEDRNPDTLYHELMHAKQKAYEGAPNRIINRGFGRIPDRYGEAVFADDSLALDKNAFRESGTVSSADSLSIKGRFALFPASSAIYRDTGFYSYSNKEMLAELGGYVTAKEKGLIEEKPEYEKILDDNKELRYWLESGLGTKYLDSPRLKPHNKPYTTPEERYNKDPVGVRALNWLKERVKDEPEEMASGGIVAFREGGSAGKGRKYSSNRRAHKDLMDMWWATQDFMYPDVPEERPMFGDSLEGMYSSRDAQHTGKGLSPENRNQKGFIQRLRDYGFKNAKGGDYTQDPEYQANEHLTHNYKDAYKRETLDGYTNWEPPVPAEAIEKNQGKNRFREVDTNKPIPEEFIKDFPEEGGDTDTPKPRPDDIGAVGTGTQTHGGQGIDTLPTRAAESAVGEMPVPKRDPMQEYIDMLMQERQDAADSKTQDKYMALLQAGLATMAGNSPNALQNIGAGAQAGIGYYKDTRAAADKQSRDALRDVMGLEARRHERAEDLGFKEREMAQKDRQLDIMSARANARGADGAGFTQKDVSRMALDLAAKRLSGMESPEEQEAIYKDSYSKVLQMLTGQFGVADTEGSLSWEDIVGGN